MKDETIENEKNLRVSENNNSKSTLTNSIHSNLPNLIKLIKKEEDLLFKRICYQSTKRNNKYCY